MPAAMKLPLSARGAREKGYPANDIVSPLTPWIPTTEVMSNHFWIFFSSVDGFDKKIVLLQENPMISDLIIPHCTARDIDLNDYRVVDVIGSTVSMNTPARSIVKRIVFLILKEPEVPVVAPRPLPRCSKAFKHIQILYDPETKRFKGEPKDEWKRLISVLRVNYSEEELETNPDIALDFIHSKSPLKSCDTRLTISINEETKEPEAKPAYMWEKTVEQGLLEGNEEKMLLHNPLLARQTWERAHVNPDLTPTNELFCKQMSVEGWQPNFPVLVIPDFQASPLCFEEGAPPGYEGENIWFNSALPSKLSKLAKVKEDEEHFDNDWMRYLLLKEDCFSDQDDFKVRAKKFDSENSWSEFYSEQKFHSFKTVSTTIKNLQCIGYRPNENLLVLPYDWRLSLLHLEERDGYFTELCKHVEEFFSRLGKPIVFLGHGMGNKLIQYFLWLMHERKGKTWLDTHIHGWVAAGSPWLGIPYAVGALMFGDQMGIDSVVSKKDSIIFHRSLGSAAMLLPGDPEQLSENSKLQGEGFLYARGYYPDRTCNKKTHTMVPYKDMWNVTGNANVGIIQEEYYNSDPFYGSKFLRPPPISRLWNVYGTNVDTPCTFFCKVDPTGEWKLDVDYNPKLPHHVTRGGVAYETKVTPQKILKDDDDADYYRSGDGVATYESLTYPHAAWAQSIPMLKQIELDGCTHRKMLQSEPFLKMLVQTVCLKDLSRRFPAILRRAVSKGHSPSKVTPFLDDSEKSNLGADKRLEMSRSSDSSLVADLSAFPPKQGPWRTLIPTQSIPPGYIWVITPTKESPSEGDYEGMIQEASGTVMKIITKQLLKYNLDFEDLHVITKDVNDADVNLNMEASSIAPGVVITRVYGDKDSKKEQAEIWVKTNETTGKLEGFPLEAWELIFEVGKREGFSDLDLLENIELSQSLFLKLENVKAFQILTCLKT
eukprot:TRINITY_DN6948_c0_g1_i3.p1 TRINITY_DN6948_c0_g1~~TRINITY_DN6948_c0_g1_i3.p1  ORF type:complete len:1011 (+),score=175.94 TRINITY_DN6948_c0_g1_i3:219-3035(+)